MSDFNENYSQKSFSIKCTDNWKSVLYTQQEEEPQLTRNTCFPAV